MSDRVLDGNWLSGYMQYVEESESPEDYHLWTGLSIIASAVRRNVWLDMGLFHLIPNLYVILVGPPGRVAKSTSIRLGRDVLLGVEDIVFGPDSVTREELIRLLAKAGHKRDQSALTIHSTELSSLIEPSGIKMIQFLTDIFDGDYKWRYSTKQSGRDTINKPVVNILAGTTPSWIAEGLPADVVGHGFTSRVIFVYGEVPRRLNPFPDKMDPVLFEALKEDLRRISNYQGVFEFTDEAKEVYTDYYKKIDQSKPRDYRVEGFHWRKRTHLLKISMLLSLAEDDSLRIQPRDVHLAWKLLRSTEEKMYKTFSAVGKNKLAADLERLLQDIQDAPKGLTAEDIYDKYYAVGDSREIAGMIHMLISMGQVARVKGEATNGNKEQARYIALYTRSHVAQKRAENFGADT